MQIAERCVQYASAHLIEMRGSPGRARRPHPLQLTVGLRDHDERSLQAGAGFSPHINLDDVIVANAKSVRGAALCVVYLYSNFGGNSLNVFLRLLILFLRTQKFYVHVFGFV